MDTQPITDCSADKGWGNSSKEFDDHAFVVSFNRLQSEANQMAHSKGWYESKLRDLAFGHEDGAVLDELQGIEDARRIALCHSELSEGLEGLRHGNPPSDHIPEFSAIEEEYADVVIRIMDHSQERGWRIAEAIIAKMQFNANRPHRHGGKKF